MMGPTIVRYALADPPAIEIWTSAEQAAATRDFDQSLAEIATHPDQYAALLNEVSEATLRSEMVDFDGLTTSKGSFIVNLVLSGCAAYRTQLFLYLKASGREKLNSSNLWAGVDAAAVQ
jgi:hypothetical protein